MVVNDWIHVMAGSFVLVGTALGLLVHPYWFAFVVFVGLNLLQYGVTKFCPMGYVLKKVGVPEGRR